jgi:hypothetical protein
MLMPDNGTNFLMQVPLVRISISRSGLATRVHLGFARRLITDRGHIEMGRKVYLSQLCCGVRVIANRDLVLKG